MKKNYIKPEAEVLNVSIETTVLAGSFGDETGNILDGGSNKGTYTSGQLSVGDGFDVWGADEE